MVFLERSLLTGVEASAAQNLPVTKTCLQCGAVLPSSVGACNFCDSAFSVGPSSWNDSLGISAIDSLAVSADPGSAGVYRFKLRLCISPPVGEKTALGGGLFHRFQGSLTRG